MASVEGDKMLGKLTKLLECPICFNTLTIPPAFCQENGHAICGTCRRSVANCPYCKSRWSGGRHIFAEQLLQVLLQECSFCGRPVQVGQKDEHEKKMCVKKVMQCFIFSRGGRCAFVFPKESLWNHLFEKHSRKIWKIYLYEEVTVPIKNVFFTKNFCVLFRVGIHKLKEQDLQILLRVFGDKDKKLLCFSVNILNCDIDKKEEYVFKFGVRRKNKEIYSFIGPCIPLPGLPDHPDRYPGGHPSNRIALSKSNHIFSDPLHHLYHFCLQIRRP